jgi:catechol 2,3-dioxygenase-like lactoylglutathione lyase family enzyme
MDTHLAVISLWAEDVPAAAHFYRDVIGLKLLPHHAGDRIHFDLDGCVLAIIPGRPALRPDPKPSFPVVAFSVSDLETAIENLRLHEVAQPRGVEKNDSG